MPLFTRPVLAIPTSTDNALMRWDGATGGLTQDAEDTLTDAGVLTLPNTTSQVIIADATNTTVTFATIALTPHLLIKQAGPTNPTMALLRDANQSASSAPTFNYFRSRSGGAVNNGDSLGIFSASGHDGTDYAAGAQIEIAVDEADSGTATVGSNSMGSMIRFQTSRRSTQSPALAFRARHNGALQLNTAITLVTFGATGMGGSFEADTKVLYYTPEDTARGVVPAIYFIAPTSTNTLTADTNEQALFDNVNGGVLTLPTGTYFFDCLLSLSAMVNTAGSNLAFDILGAGTATIASARYMTNGLDNVINTANANTGSMSNAAQSAQPIIVGAASTELQLHITGIFRVSVAGTIIPSVTLGGGAAAVVAVDSYFRCHNVGTATVQTAGNWS